MIVLDSNVLSAMMRSKHSPKVIAWLRTVPAEAVWTTAITIFEIRHGIESLGNSVSRQALQLAFERASAHVLRSRVLSFDAAAADEAAMLLAERQRRGRSVDLRDTQIAGIVRARKATLATRNIRDFADAGISLVDPWTAAPD
jgi:hypothetical protein